jgi:hypothetical protein
MRRASALIAAACTLLAAACSSQHDGAAASQATGTSNSPAPAKPNITQVTPTMVVGEDAFPQVPNATWKPGYLVPEADNGPSGSSPESGECAALFAGVAHDKNSLARAALMGQRRNPMFKIELTVPKDGRLPEWSSLASKCSSVTAGNKQYTFQHVSADQLPSWATITGITVKHDGDEDTALGVFGNYRGLFVFVQTSRQPAPTADDANAAAKLFSDQVAKLGLL